MVTMQIPKERTIRKSLAEVARQMPKGTQSLRIWITLMEFLLVSIKDEHMKVANTKGDVHESLGVIMRQLAGISMAGSRAMADLIDQLNEAQDG